MAAAVAIGLIVMFFYVRRNPQAMTDLLMKQVESHYAPDVTAQEKEDLRSAYAAFRKAAAEGRLRQQSYQDLRGTILSRGPNNDVARQQVQELTEIFRRGAGATVPPAGATPPPSAPPASATP